MNAIYTRPVAISSTGKTYNRYQRIRGRAVASAQETCRVLSSSTSLTTANRNGTSCKPRPSKPQKSKLAWALRRSRRTRSHRQRSAEP